MVKQLANEHTVFVCCLLAISRDAPTVSQKPVLKHSTHDIGIADIYSKQHFNASESLPAQGFA